MSNKQRGCTYSKNLSFNTNTHVFFKLTIDFEGSLDQPAKEQLKVSEENMQYA